MDSNKSIIVFPKNIKEEVYIKNMMEDICEKNDMVFIEVYCSNCNLKVLLGGIKGKDYSKYKCNRCKFNNEKGGATWEKY